jgi:hypothetical protein
LVDAHNAKRRLVANGQGAWGSVTQPPASNMLLMVYDSRDEYIATNYVRNCAMEHNDNRGDYGENL